MTGLRASWIEVIGPIYEFSSGVMFILYSFPFDQARFVLVKIACSVRYLARVRVDASTFILVVIIQSKVNLIRFNTALLPLIGYCDD